MKMETYEQRILIPDAGKWLYNEKDDVVSDKVFLGKNADESQWVEITEERKQSIEQARAAAMEAEVENV